MSEICERCGLDLDTLGPWKDFVHYRQYRPGENEPCVEYYCLSPETVKFIDDFAKTLTANMTKTLKLILGGK